MVVTRAEGAEPAVFYYVCEAGDPRFLGQYEPGKEEIDGVPVYNNEKDMSFYRNHGFWYLGNLGPWPPETHYRCVDTETGCNYKKDRPPAGSEGKWSSSVSWGKDPPPVVSRSPCSDTVSSTLANEEL
jgi:hypothetical protein